MNNTVAIDKCEEYNENIIKNIIAKQFSSLGITSADFIGKKIVLKPNLLKKSSPEKCITTHPAVVMAAIKMIKEMDRTRGDIESLGPITALVPDPKLIDQGTSMKLVEKSDCKK
jgi:uncharacterized protein (DUF362 family)